MEKIIIDGVDVSKCPHINAYFPDSPKCQQGMGVGGCGSECRGKCSYVDKLKIHNEIQQLKQENEELKEKLKKCANENLNEIYELIKKNDCWRGIVNVVNERLEQKLEKIEEICTSRDYVMETTSRLQKDILQIIRGE